MLLLAETEPRLNAPDLARLATDAREQLNALTRRHAIAADEAFAVHEESLVTVRLSPVGITV